MTNFKSAKEMAQALFFDNKKIRYKDWDPQEYIYWDDSKQRTLDEESETTIYPRISDYSSYSIYEEPKQPEYLYEVAGKVAGCWVMQAYLEKESKIAAGFNKTGRKFIENDKGELVEVSK